MLLSASMFFPRFGQREVIFGDGGEQHEELASVYENTGK